MSKSDLPVTPLLCERLLLNIFRELGLRSGGLVLAATLTTEWYKTGLRDKDLEMAIAGLIKKRQLRQYDFETYQLSAIGHRRIHSIKFAEIASALSARRVLARTTQRAEDDDADDDERDAFAAERRKLSDLE